MRGRLILIFAVTILFTLMTVMKAEATTVCTSPDVQLERLTAYKVVVDPGGIFNKARLYVNNEYKEYTVTRNGDIRYNSEFPIRKVEVTVVNDCGKTFREFRR